MEPRRSVDHSASGLQPLENQMKGSGRRPSDDWGSFSDSAMSRKHLTQAEKDERTSTQLLTAANIAKMYVGIAMISVSRSISKAGIYASLAGFAYVTVVNLYCVYLLLKARNRFKNTRIVDVCDLTAKLYGEQYRSWMVVALALTNILFLMCYTVYFGEQLDQLVCNTFELSECGHPHFYAISVNLLLLPAVCQRQLRNIGFFSIVILAITLSSLGMIAYVCIQVYRQPLEVTQREYGISLTEADRQYTYWNTAALPMFCATMMNIFEGNQQVLNMYAEADEPGQFFVIIVSVAVVLAICFGVSLGVLGYLAFGDQCKDTILFNMPNEAAIGVAAKACYVFTIAGSFVLLIQPIFHVIENGQWYQSLFEAESTEEAGDEIEQLIQKEDISEEDPLPESCPPPAKPHAIDSPRRWAKFLLVRALVVLLVTGTSFVVPSLNAMLTLGGSVMGTLMTIVVPVLFYNRAYSGEKKHLDLQRSSPSKKEEEDLEEGLDDDSEPADTRKIIRRVNLLVLVFGCSLGAVGFINAV